MKKMMILFCICPLFTACAGWEPVINKEEIISHTVTVPAATNTVETIDEMGTTNYVTTITPEKVETRFFTNNVAMVNPVWETSIKTLQGVNQIANPTPFAPIVNLVLMGVLGGLGWYARKKNQEAGIADLLIEGIEKANNPTVKQIIRDVANANGKEALLHNKVKSLT